ncbi:Art5p KNAG_0D04210 [Huiozyma naganishii CBS 8797]|uniref:Arrestin C-terminal-like domain-containing protein n=1 Tax=Huiozyma naganishii (strain ATCC MYA-139 / BCRC 22969 / CBS 8797 / KCTC 17520 / NBRC 10181 / NCYC 3082 / Yp74L-3) TaxID=1071383 RepID=J7RYD7_HUIN7|nr:hypothetical protein KNAG_0D04210 [Kazachstania naganishii CBS 8797]CCK70167.1 hypothetical protein KNAG_0D04210 [Kazachstania naganishii CBS 8797]
MFSMGKSQSNDIVSGFDIRVNSPYKDLILVQGNNVLEFHDGVIPLSGTVDFELAKDLIVKKVDLSLIGVYKLEFIQKSSSNVAVVKERRVIFQCNWSNLLLSQNGEIEVHESSRTNPHGSGGGSGTTSTGSSGSSGSNGSSFGVGVNGSSTPSMISLGNRFKLKRTLSSSKIIPIAPTCNETPLPEYIKPGSSSHHYFNLQAGKYSLPFSAMLPNDIPETVEGLQSGSVLYTLQARLDAHNNGNSTTIDTNDPRFRKYKYLRILRTLSSNDMSIDEEVKVGKTLPGKLQYEICVPSKAIPIGSQIPLSIKIFPFSKHFKIVKISIVLFQYYLIRDANEQVYDNESVVFKKKMVQFGDLVSSPENRLLTEFILDSRVALPDHLRKVTQDCDIQHIQVRHKLQVHLQLQRQDGTEWRNLEIKATIPIIMYISPLVPMRGRLVLYDQLNGNIHFRSGELVDLFGPPVPQDSSNTTAAGMLHQYYDDGIPPPTYEEHNRDVPIVAVPAGTMSPPPTAGEPNPVTTGLDTLQHHASSVPSYEQATTDAQAE